MRRLSPRVLAARRKARRLLVNCGGWTDSPTWMADSQVWIEALATALLAEREAGAAEERAAIVAWLRRMGSFAVHDAAAYVERGDHRKEKS